MYATVVLSQYRPALRKGHLAKIQHLCGFLNKCPITSIKFNTDMPAYDNFKTVELNWGNLYAGKPEDLPQSCPPPMGKPVLISSFYYVNLMTDMTTGRS